MAFKNVDIRDYKPRDENSIAFVTLDLLQLGETIELTYNHDPSSLFNQLMEERPNEFEWNYIVKGPDLWKVSVEKKYLSFI